MQSMRRIGLATGVLTDDEIEFIETQIVKTVRPMLVGRQVMPVTALAHAGFQQYTFYTETDMSQALIDMTGEEEAQDQVALSESNVNIPIIAKETGAGFAAEEAQLLESILNERGIPHHIQSYHDTAYNGLYQTQKGWGKIRAPVSCSEEIRAILSEIRATQISP